MTRDPRQLLGSVRRLDALTWVGLAWLAGPLPGQDRAGLWWWHAAAALLAVLAASGWLRSARGASALPAASAPLGADWWRRGRRWWTLVVVGWAMLAVIALAQLRAGDASVGDVATFAGAALVAALAPRWSVGGAAIGRLATGGAVLAGWALLSAVLALDEAGGAYAFYRVKQDVGVAGASHNVLATLLLVALVAVVVASLRTTRWRWALPMVGLALGATLSRGVLVAVAIVAVAAWLLLRDRDVALRVAIAGAVAAVVVLGALALWGAPVPGSVEAGVAGQDVDPTSVVARAQLWNTAIEAFASAPVTGVGLDGLQAYGEADGLPAPHEHAHQLVLHALATTGLPGLLAVTMVWGGLLAGAWGALDRDRRLLVALAVIGLSAHAMVEETLYRPSVEGLLALLVVVVAAPLEPAPDGTARPPWWPRNEKAGGEEPRGGAVGDHG